MDGAGFSGDFETHLTLAAGAAGAAGDDERAVSAWAQLNGLKYTRIVLERGTTPVQPMLTFRGRGSLTAQRTRARETVERLRAAGATVVRVKIEAAPWNADVPQTAEEAAALPPGCYFEHHVKLVLGTAADVAEVRELAARHAAHLSRNARRVLDDRRHERFLTQRCFGIGRPESRRRLDALVGDLAAAGFAAVEVEEEFVVHDDNPAVDAGWADSQGADT